MHSSRMHTTAVAISCGGGLPQCMLGYTPQLWAWRRPQPYPSSSPLGVGLETCKACWDNPPPTLWTE